VQIISLLKTDQNILWMDEDLAWVLVRRREASWSFWYIEHQNRLGNNEAVVKNAPI
jgi:hypothetical protein